MSAPQIFSRKARQVRRHRVARASADDRWLLNRMWDELFDRLDPPLPGSHILIIGHDFGRLDEQSWAMGCLVTRLDPGYTPGWGVAGARADEDRIDLAHACYDVVLACGTLDSVNDLPGALILIRRCLKADGRFLGALLGLGSLPLLRNIVHRGEGVQAARLHPQIDVRAGGDLLARAGFAQPVADMESIDARYRDFDRLLADLRANGIGNCLRERYPVTKLVLTEWKRAFDARRDDEGRATETFCPVYLSGASFNTAASGASIG